MSALGCVEPAYDADSACVIIPYKVDEGSVRLEIFLLQHSDPPGLAGLTGARPAGLLDFQLNPADISLSENTTYLACWDCHTCVGNWRDGSGSSSPDFRSPPGREW